MTSKVAIETKLKTKNSIFSNKNIYMYLMLLPAIISTFIFCYTPMIGLFIAFKDFDILKGFWDSPWVGLQNFISIFTYPNFISAIKNTLIYSFCIIFGFFPFPILLAIMFNELRCLKFKKVAQTITYLPHFLSWISIIGFCYSLFAINGPYNDLMVRVFGESYERVNILLDSNNFIAILFLSHSWKSIGWSSIIYLAAITGIDQEIYEAAAIDGCNRFKQIIHITLPGIKATSVIVLIMAVGGLVTSNFEQVYGFQNVFTQEKTEVINTLIYRQGIQNAEYSLATAFGLIQGVVSLSLVLTANALSKKLAKISIF